MANPNSPNARLVQGLQAVHRQQEELSLTHGIINAVAIIVFEQEGVPILQRFDHHWAPLEYLAVMRSARPAIRDRMLRRMVRAEAYRQHVETVWRIGGDAAISELPDPDAP